MPTAGRRPNVLLAAVVAAACAAAPPADPTPDDLVRAADAAFERGEFEAAEQLYERAGERAGDPGLVAFNRATVRFAQGRFREAELDYTRALRDGACPPDRRARALYNRGTCLLKRAPAAPATAADAAEAADLLRAAADDFAACRALAPADGVVKAAHVDHNLELARLRWADANAKARRQKTPNDPPPPPDYPNPPPARPPGQDMTGSDPGDAGDPAAGQATQAGPAPVPKGGARESDGSVPGGGNVPVLRGDGAAPPIPPEDLRVILGRLERRLADDQAALGREVDRYRPRAVRDR